MRVSIEKHHRDRVFQLTQQLGSDNPSVAVNYILGLWASGQLASPPAFAVSPTLPSPARASDDEFAALLDWGTISNA